MSRPHARRAVLLVCVPLLAVVVLGCKTRELRRVGTEPRTTISYAATASYPGQTEPVRPPPGTRQPAGRYELAAIVDPEDEEIEIANLGVNAVPPSAVWVNKTFVRRIPTIQPMSVLRLRYEQLLEAGSGVQDIADTGQQPRLIELETDQGLLEVPGPAYR